MNNVGQFVERLKVILADANADYWKEVWNEILSADIYATGENYCFEIRSFDELVEAPDKLFALPTQFAGNWESIAFAQSALEGMGGNEALVDFSGTLQSARIEIVRSRLYCVAHHAYWAEAETASPQYRKAVECWFERIAGERISYADDVYYEELTEPEDCLPRGSAPWLYDWLKHRYEDHQAAVCFTPRLRGDPYDPSIPIIPVDRGIVLAAAAFAWHDYSLIEDQTASEVRRLAATAGLALFFASRAAAEDDTPQHDPVESGRQGGYRRHEKTRQLKEWALAEADRMRGSDTEISRKLSDRLPEKYVGVSEDPTRLIYTALRERRSAAKRRTAG